MALCFLSLFPGRAQSSQILMSSTPIEEGIFKKNGEKTRLFFTFQLQKDDDYNVKIQISRSPEFSNMILDVITSRPRRHNWSTHLIGKFYWRLVLIDRLKNTTQMTPPRSFLIIPVPVYPAADQGHISSNVTEKPTLSFNWKVNSDHLKPQFYRFKISDEIAFEKPLINIDIQDLSYTTSALEDGKYYFKVGAKWSKKLPIQYSEVKVFNVRKVTPPAAPTSPAAPAAETGQNNDRTVLMKPEVLAEETLVTPPKTALVSNLYGIRYASPLLKSKDIVSKAPMISMFAEFRNGAAKGMRIYYEKTPMVKQKTAEGEVARFAWSRLTLGWSLDIPVPQIFSSVIHKIDITPKLGIYNLDGLFNVTNEYGETEVAKFFLKDVSSIGFESGVEHGTQSMGLFRFWFAFYRSWGLTGATTIYATSLKTGIDFYWDLFEFQQTTFKILTFGSYESLDLKKEIKDQPEVDNSAMNINQLSYKLFFFGVGATLAW